MRNKIDKEWNIFGCLEELVLKFSANMWYFSSFTSNPQTTYTFFQITENLQICHFVGNHTSVRKLWSPPLVFPCHHSRVPYLLSELRDFYFYSSLHICIQRFWKNPILVPISTIHFISISKRNFSDQKVWFKPLEPQIWQPITDTYFPVTVNRM